MKPDANAGAQAAAAPAAATGSKPTSRRKKGAAAGGDYEQRGQGKPRSASVPAVVVPDLCGATEGEDQSVLSSQGGAAGSDAGGARPPRSPVKQPKACVPTLEDALDDVQVRFVLNLPEAELSSADRLFFQLEQAWWFYEDFIADAHKHLPHFRLKEFAKLLFEHCEALRPLRGKYNELFEHFKSWKGTIPTAGCILLNSAMTRVVLVKCWKGNSRGLPKGKINQGEPAIAAALREVTEETGYDASAGASEKDCLTLYLNGQQTSMYIVTGVDEEFPFEPQVRKEISAIEWFPLDALPKGCYGVEPFIPRLRRWMAKTKGMRAPKDASADARTQSLIRVRKGRVTSPDVSSAAAAAVASSQSTPSSPTGAGAANSNASAKKQGRKGSKGAGGKDSGSAAAPKGDNPRACSAPSRRGYVQGYDAHNRDTFGGREQGNGGNEGWDFEAMLAANERLTGRTFVYDGNPHEFGDPAHAARPRGASPPPTASVPAHSHPEAREEDQVGHLKQRGGGGKNSRSVASAGDGAAGDGGDGQKGSGDARGGANGRSRSRGKANSKANAHNAGKESTETSSKGQAKGRQCDGGAGAGADENAATKAKTCLQAANSLCTEGVEGGGGLGITAVWGGGPAAGTSASEGSGLFGEFKFDMLDIMSAVPQG